MKKIFVVCMLLFSIVTVKIVDAQIPLVTMPDIVFIRGGELTYTPAGTENPVTVKVLDINGFNLFSSVPNTIPPSTTIPNVQFGRVALTVLKTVIIAREGAEANLPNHQVFAQLPEGLLDGTYEVNFNNGQNLPASIVQDVTIHANIPSSILPKSVMMFYGTLAEIVAPWQLCDGSNSTPNTQNKFIVGAGSTYAKGAIGGRKTIAGHSLTVAQLPSHTHSYRAPASSAQNVKGDNDVNVSQAVGNRTTGAKGQGAAHNHGDNRPPFHALYYICKN